MKRDLAVVVAGALVASAIVLRPSAEPAVAGHEWQPAQSGFPEEPVEVFSIVNAPAQGPAQIVPGSGRLLRLYITQGSGGVIHVTDGSGRQFGLLNAGDIKVFDYEGARYSGGLFVQTTNGATEPEVTVLVKPDPNSIGCAGDINLDGLINSDDLNALLGGFGESCEG